MMMIRRIYQYKNIIFQIVPGCIAVIVCFLFTHNFIVIIPGLILIITSTVFPLLERKRYEKQLEQVTNIIRGMIDKTEQSQISETSDIMLSKIQHQLNRLQSKLDGYDKMLLEDRDGIRKLITEIAHQLRTPLVNIKTYLDLLNESDISEMEREKYLNAIALSEEKLSFLIQSFIKMSRLENKLIQIKKESKDLKETVFSTIFQLHKRAEEKNIDISLHCIENIEAFHDKNWLGEAIYNILENSVKYSHKDSKIDINITQNEMFTRIDIRDYGMGIQKGEENQIFKRFYRGKNVSSEEGFGVGLYLSREIVTKHKGFIKVKRETPGLRMSVFLPQQ